jgi:hypothetical protein
MGSSHARHVGGSRRSVWPYISATVLVAAGIIGLIAPFLPYFTGKVVEDLYASPGAEASLWDVFHEGWDLLNATAVPIERRGLSVDVASVLIALAPGLLALAIGAWTLARAILRRSICSGAAMALGAGVVWLFLTVGWAESFRAVGAAWSLELTYGIGLWLLVLAGVGEVAGGVIGSIARTPDGGTRTRA